MKERIQEFIDSKGISAGELASLLEVQRSNISHILNGRNKPGASLIEKMLIVFPELNARWLLTGEGTMFENQSRVSSELKMQQDNKEHKTISEKPVNDFLTDKRIEKVVLLYTDGTFKSFTK